MNDARRRYGTRVWVITPLARAGEQVFHAGIGLTDGSVVHTGCGRRARGELVHVDHASRFARPCCQCWRVQQLPLFRAVA